jgi:hypothetical protein
VTTGHLSALEADNMPSNPQPAAKRRESRVEFLGDQDGPRERALKSLIARELMNFATVERAYLARVGFAPDAAVSVALCLAPKPPETASIVHAVSRLVHSSVPSGVFLDIIFVTPGQEDDLARVCRAFYVSKQAVARSPRQS